MFLDALTLLSNAQAVTSSAYSSNTIDLGAGTPVRSIGDGEPVALGVSVDVAADFTSMDETYEVQIVESANENLGSHVVVASHVFTAAERAAGSLIVLPLPPGYPVGARYIGARYVTGGMSPSVTVTAWMGPLSMISQRAKAYRRNYAV